MCNGVVNAAEAYSAAFTRMSARHSVDWEITDWSDGPLQWRFFRRCGVDLPVQGWKIHVTASATEAPELLAALGTLPGKLAFSFKIPRRLEDIVFLNSGDAGLQQLGKIVTIYPGDDEQAREIIMRMDRLWPSSRGPEVQSDLHTRPGSAVSFRYGVFGSGATTVSSTGVHDFALVFPDGSRAPDKRLPDGEQHGQAPPPPVECCPPSPFPVRLNETFRAGNSSYIALALLGDTPRMRIFLGADLESLQTVVLKVGRPGVAGDQAGVDIGVLMQKEYHALAALEGQDGLVPRVLEWVGGDWPVLVMEDFRGELLSELPRSVRIRCMPMLADAVSRMHAAGIVHGDIKLENAVHRGAQVGLIDFELAEAEGAVARQGGTRGHMGPETDAGARIAPSRDVFALGGCMVQALLDIPPGLLPAGAGRYRALFHNEDCASAAMLVATFNQPDPGLRPDAATAATMLASGIDTLVNIVPARGRPASCRERKWYRRAAMDAAQLAGTYARPGPDGTCWRNTHFMKSFDCEAINIGAAGIMLGLQTIDSALGRNDYGSQIDQGARWLSGRSAQESSAGLFTGNAGVAVALAVAGCRLEKQDYLDVAKQRFAAAVADRREIDLFSGCAGVVWAACLLNEILQQSWPVEMATPAYCHLQAQAGAIDGVPVWGAGDTPEAAYLGCAHGSAGVAMALACWGRLTADHDCIDMARDAFRRIAADGRTQDGKALRITLRDHRHHAVGNWCHGVAGYLWSILQGVGDDPALRDEIDWAVGSLMDVMAVGTPTYCHGLAGQLELWRMLGSIPRYRSVADARAGKVARALRIVHHKVDGRCVWIADDPDITTPDLWVGFLGPATALAMHAAGIRPALLSGEWLSACADQGYNEPSATMAGRATGSQLRPIEAAS